MKSFLISKFNSAHVRIKGVTANNSNWGGRSLTKGQFSSFHTLKMHPIHQMLSLMCKCLYTPSWWTRICVIVTGQVPQSHTEGQLCSYPFLTPHWLFLTIILHQQEGACHSERLNPVVLSPLFKSSVQKQAFLQCWFWLSVNFSQTPPIGLL